MTSTPTASPTPTTSAAAAPRKRVSLLRVLVLLVSLAAIGFFGYRTAVAAIFGPPTPGPSVFSPYVDATAWPPYAFESPDTAAQSQVTLAFIVAGHDDACAPSWGGYYSLDEAAEELEMDRRVEQLRRVGGDVRVSFGGAINNELATVCDSPVRLADAYRDVIDRYDLSVIDLDIEGPALADTEANARRATAIAALQAEAAEDGDSLGVWVTLPVGPEGLTDAGLDVVEGLLTGGVNLSGVNGMTMNLGVPTTTSAPQSGPIVDAALALHDQVQRLYGDAGVDLSDNDTWGRVGLTVMVGQNDITSERFYISDAEAINAFARTNGVGLLSMWSLNRDDTCSAPLPSETTVVQDNCSGIDQQGQSFAVTLAANLPDALDLDPTGGATIAPTTAPQAAPTVAPGSAVDDPATSPYPIWDPLAAYPGGTKVVWRQQVYEARFWTQGFQPDTPVENAYDSPWTLIGPVLETDAPAPLPTLPEGTYPAWDAAETYVAGDRVQVGEVPYEAKWWNEGIEPGTYPAGGSPWVLIYPVG